MSDLSAINAMRQRAELADTLCWIEQWEYSDLAEAFADIELNDREIIEAVKSDDRAELGDIIMRRLIEWASENKGEPVNHKLERSIDYKSRVA
jgi:hypothetical protein